ncbi:hypothetical protein NDN08_006747 [Rhodosorus marinus]|uniref:PiggyBac transposable element-derived protein 4 C-terminal zinc-ribbon domain-containing protein n=1 Tax=Rhodosorus marinus TaxID=101924 RepID=A0AAV8UIG7_9RHOD|nr:hypothetical protein NDN08_006747 [Rhodosorus marinus]
MRFFGRAINPGIFNGLGPVTRRARKPAGLESSARNAPEQVDQPLPGSMIMLAVPKKKRSKNVVKWRRYLMRPDPHTALMKCEICGKWKEWRTLCPHKCPGRRRGIP